MPMPEWFYRLQVLALALFGPVALFHRINRLPWYRDTLRRWADELGYGPGDSVLEVGCATGLLSHYLAGRGAGVNALDRSDAMIRRARAGGDGDVVFRQGDIMALPYGGNRFDYVISASVLNVVAEPQAAMGELARVCREGGYVSVLVPSSAMDRTRLAGLKEGLGLSGFSAAAMFMWDRLATKMDGGQVQQLLRRAGLEDVATVEYLDGLVIGVEGRKPGTTPVS